MCTRVCACVCLCVFNREPSQLHSELHDKPPCNFPFQRTLLNMQIVSFLSCGLIFDDFRFYFFFMIQQWKSVSGLLDVLRSRQEIGNFTQLKAKTTTGQFMALCDTEKRTTLFKLNCQGRLRQTAKDC